METATNTMSYGKGLRGQSDREGEEERGGLYYYVDFWGRGAVLASPYNRYTNQATKGPRNADN